MNTRHTSILLILALAISAMLASCTQNNGHIGKLFGSWSLTEMTLDGESVPLPDQAIGSVLSFQNDIACFQLIYSVDRADENYCTWTRNDNLLTFDFDHGDNDHPAGTDFYAPPSWLGFSDLHTSVLITELTGGRLTFVRTDDTHTYIYRFERTW